MRGNSYKYPQRLFLRIFRIKGPLLLIILLIVLLLYITLTPPMQLNAIFHGSMKMNSVFHMKIWYFFLIYGPNIECGCLLELPHRGSSNKHPQSMFWAKIRKIMYTPAYPSFPYIKCGLRECSLHGLVNMMLEQILFNNKILEKEILLL